MLGLRHSIGVIRGKGWFMRRAVGCNWFNDGKCSELFVWHDVMSHLYGMILRGLVGGGLYPSCYYEYLE